MASTSPEVKRSKVNITVTKTGHGRSLLLSTWDCRSIGLHTFSVSYVVVYLLLFSFARVSFEAAYTRDVYVCAGVSFIGGRKWAAHEKVGSSCREWERERETDSVGIAYQRRQRRGKRTSLSWRLVIDHRCRSRVNQLMDGATRCLGRIC